MINLKKLAMVCGIASASVAFAQQTGSVNSDNPQMKNMIKLGVSGGPAVPAATHKAALGLDLSYQYLVTPGFGLGISTGYTHYFGKDENVFMSPALKTEYNDVGVIPVAALVRVYPKDWGVYFGADLGYGVLVGDDKVASNIGAPDRPTGGFYLKPEVGYHNRDWNFSVHYQKVFTNFDAVSTYNKYNVGSLGVGVSYNIPLGQ